MYSSYIFQDSEMVGRFEDMYAAVEDPWLQEKIPSSAEPVALAYIQLLPKISDILDIGCGTGRFTAEIARQTGAKVTGLDISDTAITKATAKYGADATFTTADVPPLPTHAKSIDLVICSELLWYVLPNIGVLFEEITRVLRPGGYVLFVQQFYGPGVQKYGRSVMIDPADLERVMPFKIITDETIDLKWVCMAQSSKGEKYASEITP